jgi:hypothetical protein
MYQVVGANLAQISLEAPSESDMDAFGRSAFNRYYYSSYLTARELLGQFDPEWRTQGHSNVPGLLKDSAKDVFLKAAKKARRTMPDNQVDKSLNQAINGLGELAKILTEGYAIRVLADYMPETKAVRESGKITLGPASLSSAAFWPKRSKILASLVITSGRELGIL